MNAPKLGVRAAAIVYFGAGLTLVCNDWWLKGAGLLPGWLTGKLSDFAGLVVAVVTVSLFLGQRALGAAKVAGGVIALVFALVKLDRTCTDLLVAALAGIGLSWSVRTDPTDLVALAVLPLAWSTARTLAHRLQHAGPPRLILRASAIPAALACLASGVPDEFSAYGYVYNDSGKVVLVEVSVTSLDCNEIEAVGTDWLAQTDFESTGLYQIAPNEVLPLQSCTCIHRLSFEGKSVIVRTREDWVGLEQSPEREAVREDREHLIFVRPGEALLPGSSFEVLEVPLTAPASSCSDEPAPMTFGARVTDLVDARVMAIEPVAGQCWELLLGAAVPPSATDAGGAGAAGAAGAGSALGGASGAAGLGGASSDAEAPPGGLGGERVQLCVPPDLIPFSVGDVVTLMVRALPSGYAPTHQLKLIESTGARGLRLELGSNGFARTEEALRCGPDRDDAGQPYLPTEVTVYPSRGVDYPGYPGGPFAVSDLSPGERREVVLADGARTQLYVGRARRFPYNFCDGVNRPDPHEWIEVVESWSE